MKFVLTVLSVFIITLITTAPPTLGANRVLSLDGRGSSVEVQHSESLNMTQAITLEAWVFLSEMQTGNAQAWVSKYMGPQAWDVHSDAFFISRDGEDQDALEFSTPREDWVHVAAVYDGKKQRVYINGNLEAEQDLPGTIAPTNSMVQIGTHGNQYWPGMLDEIRIWNVVRTPAEIRATMNAPLTGDETGLAAYWNFDDDTADDGSKNENHGMALGDAQIVIAPLPDDFISMGESVIVLEDKIVTPGETFSKNISVCLAKIALHGFAFDLRFDPAMLQVVNVEEGNFLSRAGADATKWETPQVDNGNGVVTNVQCRRTETDGVEGNEGVLASVTFKAQKSGGSAVRVENLTLFSPDGAEIPSRELEGSVDIFPHGRISGVVRDAEDDTPISGATIEVSNRWLSFREVYSDTEGKYTLSVVPVGNITVRASRGDAYFTTTIQADVKEGEITTNVDFEMKPTPLPPAPDERAEDEGEEIEDF